MKFRTLTSIITLAALCGLSSCLDEDPKGLLNEDQAFNSASNIYINTVATLYNYIGGSEDSQGLEGTYRGVYDYNTFTTDEAIIPIRGGDWYDGGYWQNLYLHQWTASDNELYNTWCYLYKVVELCNRSLYNLDKYASKLTQAQLAANRAEVRAVRAIYYAYLNDMFGRVPLDTTLNSTTEQLPQSSRSATYRWVVNELQAVAPQLALNRSNMKDNYYGRVTRPVVWFVLAKLALNAEVYADDDWTDASRPQGSNITFNVGGRQLNAWQACAAYCDSITAFGYRLEDDYATNFQVNNETSRENIFVIPMDRDQYTNRFMYLFRSRHYNQGGVYGMASENGACATISTVHAYGYRTAGQDKRYAINFFSDTLRVDGNVVTLDDGSPLVYYPLEVKVNLTGSPYMKTAGARMAKYEVDRSAYDDGKLQNNDIVLYRYADVLLMKAEALVRNGQDGSAELNAVRARAGMAERPATLSNILQERLLELMWEGWRRNDLVRFGLYGTAYDLRPQTDADRTGATTVFPIPTRALQLNNRLTQNP